MTNPINLNHPWAGMALVSMCISLMQEQLVQKTRWLLTEVGIIEEDIDPMQKYKVIFFELTTRIRYIIQK